MSSTYDKMWVYQIHNNILHLFEYDSDGVYDAPTEGYDHGLKVEYVTGSRVFVDSDGEPQNTSPTELSILNCKDAQIPAILSFVRYKMAESEGNIPLRDYWYNDFTRQRSKAATAAKAGASVCKVPTPYAFR